MLEDACERGVERVSLETGSMEFFAPARALYEKVGFATCSTLRVVRRRPPQRIHDPRITGALRARSRCFFGRALSRRSRGRNAA